MKNLYEVMFWNEANEAILFGTVSKFNFESESEAEEFVKGITVNGCKEISVTVYGKNEVIDSWIWEVLED